MTTIRKSELRLTLLAASIPAVFGTHAQAQDEMTRLTKPESSVSVGFGYVDDDNRYFGQYNGLNEKGFYGLLDLDLVRRDDTTGTWIRFTGRNLGLTSRELRFEHERQGNWGYFFEYSQTPRYEPLLVTTAVRGIGTPNLGMPAPYPSSGADTNLEMERKATTLGFSKLFGEGFDFQLRFRNEEKDGARIFARGTTGGGGFEFTPEPLNSTTQIVEATLSHSGARLQLSAGYYGSFYKNHNMALNVTGSPGGLAGFSPIALPPSNEAHQFFVTGGYSLTQSARLNFKASHSRATQEEAFIVAPAAGVGRSNLGGKIEVTQAQVGLTARPLPKLSVLANLRYENREDETPVARYFTGATPTSTFNGDNEPRSIRTFNGKMEATYQLPMGFRLTGGADYDEKTRNSSAVRVVSHRDTTDETSWRIELRRAMSETINGTLGFVHSQREGTDWQRTVRNNGTTGSNLIHPIYLADRDRQKWRVLVDWAPIEALSLQFLSEGARDHYSGRSYGLNNGSAQLYSLDGTFSISDDWQLTAWISRNETEAEQITCENASATGGPPPCPNNAADPVWIARLGNRGDAYGLGIRGKPSGKIEVGGDVQYTRDRGETYQQPNLAAAVHVTPLPEILYKLVSIRLFGKYALQANAGVRADLVYERRSNNDWTWSGFTYTDGTRVVQSALEDVTFLGMSAYYKWW